MAILMLSFLSYTIHIINNLQIQFLWTLGALTDLEKQYGPLMHNPRASARSPLGPKSLAGHSTQRFKRSYASLSPNLTLKAAAAGTTFGPTLNPVGAPLGSSDASEGHLSPPLSSSVVAVAAECPQATVHHGAAAPTPVPAATTSPTPSSSPALTIASAESVSLCSSTANSRPNNGSAHAAIASSTAPAIPASGGAGPNAAESAGACVSVSSNVNANEHKSKAAHHNGTGERERERQAPPNVDVTRALARDLLAIVACEAASSSKSNNATNDEQRPVDFASPSSAGALLASSAAANFSADALLSPALGLRPSKALLGKQ